MRPVGGLLTAVAITDLGFTTSNAVSQRHAIDTNRRLYTELMSRREEAESALRKDTCVSIINSFVNPRDTGLSASVLSLEMLACNFHESLNLKPLFTEMRRRLIREQEEASTELARPENAAYLERLEGTAREIVNRKMIVLEGVDRVNREIRIGLNIETPDPEMGRQTKVANFGVSYFDFPMIDNAWLVGGQRCSVVLKTVSPASPRTSRSCSFQEPTRVRRRSPTPMKRSRMS